MISPLRPIASVVAAIIVATSVIAARQPQETARANDGVLALISGGPDWLGRVNRALASPDPLIRTVAARLAGGRNLIEAAANVERALDVEQDVDAEVEETRALLFLRGAPAVDALLARRYHSGRPIAVIADWLARTHPDDLPERVQQMVATLGESASLLNRPLLLATRTRPAIARATLRAWLAAAPAEAWRDLIGERSFDPGEDGVASVVVEALRSPVASIREATVWMLVRRMVDRLKMPAVVQETIAADGLPDADIPATWETFGRELLTRFDGGETPERSVFLLANAVQHRSDSLLLGRVEGLASTERKALRSALGEDFPERPAKSPALPSAPPGVRAAARSLPILWPGLLDALVKDTGCSLSTERKFSAIHAFYAPDGRTSKLEMDPGTLSPECATVIRAIAVLIVAEQAYGPIGPAGEWIVVPMDSDYLACTNEPARSWAMPPRTVGRGEPVIKPPTKIRNVPPVYPPAQIPQGVQGVVVIESTISASGCPAALRVIRSVHPALDASALQAVSAWRFTPTRVDGQPVAVIMTTTVSFSLR